MSKKFALVVPALLDGGGVPAVADFIYRVARDAGWQVQIVSLSSSREDRTSRAITNPRNWMKGPCSEGGVWEDRPIVHVGSDWAEIEFARYRVRPLVTPHVRNCSFIQVVSGSAAWANCVIGLGKRVSLQVATRAVEERKMRYQRDKGPLRHWRKAMTLITDRLERSALSRVDAIQVENYWMLEFAREQALHTKSMTDIRFAPPGVDIEQFAYIPYPRVRGTPFILSVGRMGDPRKNPMLLLESFARAAPHLPGVNLVTAGASTPPDEYFERAASHGLSSRVQHVSSPSVDELVSLYQRASVFALSSEEEGLGIVLLEAMSCGTPAVATRCGGPESIISDGVDGFLVDRRDSASMADRLVRLFHHPELVASMSKAARQTIDRKFSTKSAGAAFRDVWTGLSTEGRHSAAPHRSKNG